MSENEQDKTEEATPFKLKKAREKGNIARGSDLGFFSTLSALGLYTLIFGNFAASVLTDTTRTILGKGLVGVTEVDNITALITVYAGRMVIPVAILGGMVFIFVIVLEILQLRGLTFSATPLKPDLNRLNPAKGLKRIFSMKTLKDAAKNILKMITYCIAAGVVTYGCINILKAIPINANSLATHMSTSGSRLLFTFILLALFFAIIDQIISRNEFRKQMRMSKSELKREVKDREGEPRLKQRRRQLHTEFAKQAKGVGNLEGSDIVITNPTHIAVALRYDAEHMSAPTISAMGAERIAEEIRRRAFLLSIPIIQDPPLARKLYETGKIDGEILPEIYEAVANLYLTKKLGSR